MNAAPAERVTQILQGNADNSRQLQGLLQLPNQIEFNLEYGSLNQQHTIHFRERYSERS